jgi:hypothetical protein
VTEFEKKIKSPKGILGDDPRMKEVLKKLDLYEDRITKKDFVVLT